MHKGNRSDFKAGLSENVVNAVALYMYYKKYPKTTNAFAVFNDFASATGYKPESLIDAKLLLESIDDYLSLTYAELEENLIRGHFFKDEDIH